jgi:hypothetical protein
MSSPPKWRSFLQSVYAKYPKVMPNFLLNRAFKQGPQAEPAFAAFHLLGTNAYPVIPVLNLMITNRNWLATQNTARCLDEILYQNLGPDRPRSRRQRELFNDPDPVISQAATNAGLYHVFDRGDW